MLRATSTITRWAALACVFALGTNGCKNKGADGSSPGTESSAAAAATGATPSGSASAAEQRPSAKEAREVAATLPPAEKVQGVVNPKKRAAYTGPVGGVRGLITVSGDLAPDLPEVIAKIEDSCAESRSVYGKVFREGPGRSLADVLVAVTGYDGYVPSEKPDVVVHAKGCAFHTRTVAMTFGQRLVIQGEDNRPYVPEILGQPQPAQLFVLPTMPRVSIAPQNPGLFKLVDSMRLFSVAELYVLPYRTVAVTGLDGHFEIQGIPAGPVRIDALLPQTSGVTGRDLVIEPGKTLDINLQIAFDRSAWDKAPKAAALETRPAQ